jgi:steroid 5-alpha reductase family enzyme
VDRWTLVLTGMASALGLMTLVWIASVIRRDASLVDRAWGLVFVLLAGVYLVGAEDPTPRSYLAAALVTIWGVRLSVYLTWRNWGEGEDWRYGMMRERYPKRFALTSLVTIFWGQGLAAVGVGTPLLAAVRDGQPESLGWLDGVGVAVWIVGFVFEAVGDRQLAKFKSDPLNRGRVLDGGLWRYTRHPNYFGDATQWWGLGLIGSAAGAWWSILGPAGMTFVLLRVTGVILTERHLRSSRGGAYEDYVRRTSPFIPWPPRSGH